MSKEIYRNTVEFQVSGDYALFSDILTRPGGEKMSYPIPTYESLKGILSSVYWKPTIIWIVDSVRVMNRIRMVRKGIRPLKYLKRLQHGRRLPPDIIDIFFFKFGEKCVTCFIISRFSAGIVNIFADKRQAAILPC